MNFISNLSHENLGYLNSHSHKKSSSNGYRLLQRMPKRTCTKSVIMRRENDPTSFAGWRISSIPLMVIPAKDRKIDIVQYPWFTIPASSRQSRIRGE